MRKYREKKKARSASLEDEVVRLRALNQHLMKRLKGQAFLEAEITRLKCLLADIREKPTKSRHVLYQTIENPCNMQCDDLSRCLHPGSETALNVQASTPLGDGDCGSEISQSSTKIRNVCIRERASMLLIFYLLFQVRVCEICPHGFD